jgi:hypothetical protein
LAVSLLSSRSAQQRDTSRKCAHTMVDNESGSSNSLESNVQLRSRSESGTTGTSVAAPASLWSVIDAEGSQGVAAAVFVLASSESTATRSSCDAAAMTGVGEAGAFNTVASEVVVVVVVEDGKQVTDDGVVDRDIDGECDSTQVEDERRTSAEGASSDDEAEDAVVLVVVVVGAADTRAKSWASASLRVCSVLWSSRVVGE